MKFLASICLAIFLTLHVGCGSDSGTADVEGKPALKADPNAEKGKGGGSFSGMQMDPTQMMLMRMDKNRDGQIQMVEYSSSWSREQVQAFDQMDANRDGCNCIDD